MSILFFPFLILISQASPTEVSVEPQNLENLDRSILLERLKRIYGSFGSARPSVWTVSMAGQVETWEWDGKSFSCPNKTTWDCSLWVPKSFEWWLSRNAWLDNWVSFKRSGFFLNESEPTRRGQSSRNSSADLLSLFPEEANEENAESVEASTEEESVEIGGKKQAFEVWDWVGQSGESVKAYSSLRNQWIERIDYNNSREYIEWVKKDRWSKPEIKSVVLDRDGQRVSFQFSKAKK